MSLLNEDGYDKSIIPDAKPSEYFKDWESKVYAQPTRGMFTDRLLPPLFDYSNLKAGLDVKPEEYITKLPTEEDIMKFFLRACILEHCYT